MNRLELVRRLREKVGAAGTGPVSTVAQSGEALRLVNLVDEAWLDIQTQRTDWLWMRDDFFLTTTAGVGVYPLADLGAGTARVIHGTLTAYAATIGRNAEGYLDPLSWDDFKHTYDFGQSAGQTGAPSAYALRPRDGALMLGPVPAGAYRVLGERQLLPVALTADTDVPGLPEQFHWIIIYRAMMLHAEYEAAPEVRFSGETGYKLMRSKLDSDQLQQVTL